MAQLMQFEKGAWIWSPGGRRFNTCLCFRKEIELAEAPSELARLRITADARYELYVNGRWLGHGPPRSWPAIWPVDEYDVRGNLAAGRNVIAVLVTHPGVGNFQYLHADGGLLAELTWRDDAGEHALGTDESWRVCPHEGFAWPVPRVAPQQAWEEQFDASRLPGSAEWTEPGFGDSTWPGADVVRPAGAAPHEQFELRDIPMLALDSVSPHRLVSIEAVRPADYTWSVNVQHLFNSQDLSANVARTSLFLATYIQSPARQKIQLHDLPGYFPRGEWKLNGKLLTFDDRSLQKTDAPIAHATLNKGTNTLLFRFAPETHAVWIQMNVWTQQPVKFEGMLTGEQRGSWLMVGPFAAPPPKDVPPGSTVPPSSKVNVVAENVDPDATVERYEAIWNCGRLEAADLASGFVRLVPDQCISPVDVFALTAGERVVPDVAPKVAHPDAMLHDNADWSTIYPVTGADVRLLLDFGREMIGYHEFEIDAPAGTIVDAHNFEFIQRDGRYNLAEGVNNTFRYVCRAGAQRYRTFGRRGFQYTWLTLRRFDRPVRIRHVRVLYSAYPQASQGSFTSSDELLNRMWQVGVHSVRCCSEDTYTDCPSYEQTHWVGDARNEALVDLIANGDARLSRHCWIQTARSLDRSPIIESHVPSAWQNILPAFVFLWMRWAEEHHRLTGDDSFVEEAMPYLDRNFAGIEQHVNDRGLFDIVAWNMFDWAPMDTPSRGIVTHQNCLAVLGLRRTAQLAERVGDRKRAKAWSALADRISTAVNRHLWDSRKNAFYDCIHANGKPSRIFSQQTQTAAYISGVATGTREKRCRAIVENPPKGFVRAGSPFFMFFVLEGLVREGRWREMIEQIRSYWGAQIEAGATAFWEMYYPDRERKARSHCHGWSAAPVFFLSYYTLGIQPAEPGFSRVRIAPQPGDLRWAHGRMPTPHGAIDCRWENGPREFFLEVRLPKKLPMEIEIPFAGRLDVEIGKAARKPSPRGTVRLQSRSGHLKLRIRQ